MSGRGIGAVPSQLRQQRRLDLRLPRLLAAASTAGGVSLRGDTQGQSTPTQTLRFRASPHNDGPRLTRDVPETPADPGRPPSTTIGHRCNWANRRCWSVAIARSFHARSTTHHHRATFPRGCWGWLPISPRDQPHRGPGQHPVDLHHRSRSRLKLCWLRSTATGIETQL